MAISNLLRKLLPAAAVAAAACAALVMLPSVSHSQSKPGLTPDPKAISFTLPEKINWTKGANQDSAVLFGDPSKPGLYGTLTKWHAGNMSRPHSHPNERYIYVLEGTWWMGWGSEYKPENTFPVKAGSFVVHHANELHYDGAKQGDALLYIVGMGPANAPAQGKK